MMCNITLKFAKKNSSAEDADIRLASRNIEIFLEMGRTRVRDADEFIRSTIF